MPFTIDGTWVPSKPEEPQTSGKPVKVRLIKRGKNMVTVVLNLQRSPAELAALASHIKKKLGCGGAVKEGEIEFQGDKVEPIKKCLLDSGIKSS